MCEKLHHKNAEKVTSRKNENLMIREDYFKRIEYCGGNDLALLSSSVVRAVCRKLIFNKFLTRECLKNIYIMNPGYSSIFNFIHY